MLTKNTKIIKFDDSDDNQDDETGVILIMNLMLLMNDDEYDTPGPKGPHRLT